MSDLTRVLLAFGISVVLTVAVVLLAQRSQRQFAIGTAATFVAMFGFSLAYPSVVSSSGPFCRGLHHGVSCRYGALRYRSDRNMAWILKAALASIRLHISSSNFDLNDGLLGDDPMRPNNSFKPKPLRGSA